MKQALKLLFALPLLLVACNSPIEDPGYTPKVPKLELLSESLMQIDGEAGDYTILYNLEKGDEAIGGETGITNNTSPITSQTNASWITIERERSFYGELAFSVAKNDSGEKRSGKITLSYRIYSVEVTVEQAAAEAQKPEDEPTGIKGWAVVGTMTNNWDVDSAIAMEEIDGYYAARGVELNSSDSFKFILDGSMQDCLCGNGQSAERDCKYPTQKYGSDLRVKESGRYDLYINTSLTTYYVMSEGKSPTEAHEIVAPGEDAWYVSGAGEEIRMHNAGVFIVASNIALDADGFKIRNTLTGSYGATTDAEAEIGDEIEISANAENNIMVKYDASKTYDIYIKVDILKVWVVESRDIPDYVYECTAGEGAWFDGGKNFYIHLTGDGIAVTLDCMLSNSVNDKIIPETTFVVAYGDDCEGINYIIGEGSQVVNMDGKRGVVSGEVTVKHNNGKYDITVDIVNLVQHRVRAHYCGDLVRGAIGYEIELPKN